MIPTEFLERMDLKKGNSYRSSGRLWFCPVRRGWSGSISGPFHQMQMVMHGGPGCWSKRGSSDSRGRREGRIVRTIAEERPREIVGRYFVEQGVSLVVPDDDALSTKNLIIPPELVNGARHGQIVVAEIVLAPKST